MNTTLSETDDDLYNLVSSISVTAIAFIGNSIVFYILAQKEFRKESFFRYLLVGTIFDTITALLIWPINSPNFFLIDQLQVSCALFFYISDLTSTLSGWILILTSIYTFLLVKYPTKYKFIQKLKYQMLILGIILIVSCFLFSTDWILMIVDPQYGCVAVSTIIAFYLNLTSYSASIIFPFFITVLLNILTYLELRKIKVSSSNSIKNGRKLFKVSLGLDLLFLFSNVPIVIVYLTNNLSGLRISVPVIVLKILDFLSCSYFSLDLLVYLIANRAFREYFLELSKSFCFWKKKI